MITYVFRKRTPAVFSIEKLFDALYGHLERCGESMRRLELPRVSSGLASVMRNVWFIATRRNAGIIHITGDVHYAALLRPWSKTVITIHDCVVLQRGTGLKQFVLRLLWFTLPLRAASAIVVISEQTRREVLSLVAVPPAKLTVIPNFVDPGFTPSVRPFAVDQPRILHVGTTPNKNLPKVIAALRGIPCILVIVGPLTESLVSALATGGVQYENFVGVNATTMMRLYSDADIISFPSTYEGFGMPILEGQAVGRPVLTSDLEPMRQVAGPGGALLIDPGSVESIREGFLQLIRDGRLRTGLVAAGLVNCRRFTLEAVAAGYRSLYRTLEAC